MEVLRAQDQIAAGDIPRSVDAMLDLFRTAYGSEDVAQELATKAVAAFVKAGVKVEE